MQSRMQIIPALLPGQATTVRLLIRHPMETGFRFGMNGAAIPKNVIQTLIAHFEGVLVFKATLGTGMAADPFLQFEVQTPRSGELVLAWSDDSGEKGQARAQIEVKT